MSRLSIAGVAALLLAAPVGADAQGVALALRAGTFGPSVGLVTDALPMLNVRVDVPYFSYERSSTERIDDFDLVYDASFRFFSVSGIVDVHPFQNAFRLSAGVIYNGNEATFTGRSGGPYTVSGTTYSAEELGELSGTIEMGSRVAPYAGIGFGNALRGGRLGFTFDAGVMFNASPRVSMTGTGMIAPTANEATTIEGNLEWARYYPGLSIGLTYRIF